MLLQSALDAPARYQWEESSGTFWASQSNNCGPTCVTKIAHFYRDIRFGIEDTRRLVTGCCVPTTASQQAAMLTARGVPATAVWIDSLAQLDELLGTAGTRPIILGIEMWRVPAAVRDHPFLGWHAVCVMARARLSDGREGYWVNDPNFSPPGGNRPDPDGGRKFYSRSVMQYAYIDNWIRWSVVPNRHKQVFVNKKVEGDPSNMGVRFVPEWGKKVTIKADKPIRSGISIKSPTIKRFADRHAFRLFGRIKKEDMALADRPYGPVWVGPLYRTDGKYSLGYVMHADIVEGSLRDD